MPTDMETCELLEWDTAFWRFRIGKVAGDILTEERAELIERWCRAHQIACLYFLARSDDAETTRVAEDCGFRLVDIRLTLRCEPVGLFRGDTRGDQDTVLIRDSRPDDVPELERIAAISHRETRFYYDMNFPRSRCASLYETWIRRSCEGYADVVLVAEVDAVPAGYVACRIEEEPGAGRIGLLGVSDRMRGRGIGRALVRGSLMWFRERLTQTVTVVTPGRNRAGQRLYQRCGFVTDDTQLWYHKWYSMPPHV